MWVLSQPEVRRRRGAGVPGQGPDGTRERLKTPHTVPRVVYLDLTFVVGYVNVLVVCKDSEFCTSSLFSPSRDILSVLASS